MKPPKLLLALALTFAGAGQAHSYNIWTHMLHGEALLDTLPFVI